MAILYHFNVSFWRFLSLYELDTVIGSDLTDLDEDIKLYLLDPNLPAITRIKVLLYYHIINQPKLGLQLDALKEYMGIPSFKELEKWYFDRVN